MEPALPTSTIRWGCACVPNNGVPRYDSGSATGPPEPKSASILSSQAASNGVKKSSARNDPLGCTLSRTTDSLRSPGGVRPGVGPVSARCPLPVASRIHPGPSEISGPPDCQMPEPFCPDTCVVHIVVVRPAVDTPTTQPV